MYVLNTKCGSDEHDKKIEELLHVELQTGADDSGIDTWKLIVLYAHYLLSATKIFLFRYKCIYCQME